MPTDEEMKAWRDDESTNDEACPWCGHNYHHGENCPVIGFMNRLHQQYSEYVDQVNETDLMPPCPCCGHEASVNEDGDYGLTHADGCDFLAWFRAMQGAAIAAQVAEMFSALPGVNVQVAVVRGDQVMRVFGGDDDAEG